jgi:hypothetical protein
MIAALGLAIPTPAEADNRAQKAAAAKAKKAEAAQKKAQMKRSIAEFKQRLKVGKPALKRALADRKALARRESALRKQRLQQKGAVDSTKLAQRANDTPATRTAYNNALAAYMPTRNAHEAVLAQLQKAQSDVRQIRAFQYNATSRAKPTVINPIAVEPGRRPRVDPRFVVNIAPTAVAVAGPGGALLGGEAVPRRTEPYGPLPQVGSEAANYGPLNIMLQPPPSGAQSYRATRQGEQFKVRQNANEFGFPDVPQD